MVYGRLRPQDTVTVIKSASQVLTRPAPSSLRSRQQSSSGSARAWRHLSKTSYALAYSSGDAAALPSGRRRARSCRRRRRQRSRPARVGRFGTFNSIPPRVRADRERLVMALRNAAMPPPLVHDRGPVTNPTGTLRCRRRDSSDVPAAFTSVESGDAPHSDHRLETWRRRT